MFEIQLFSFKKDYDGFWLDILSVDIFGDFDRSLFMAGKRNSQWFLEMFFIRITPR